MTALPPNIAIRDEELEESFHRASGPGGQNVNKLETAVQLRFDARAAPGLPPPVRARLLALAGRRATKDGVVVIFADRFRTRERNRADARERLFALVRAAAAPPPPPRRATRPTQGSVRRNAEAKTLRGAVKRLRRPPDGGE